jgi:hypothetical protein
LTATVEITENTRAVLVLPGKALGLGSKASVALPWHELLVFGKVANSQRFKVSGKLLGLIRVGVQ